MGSTFAEVTEAALSLPADEQLKLARTLMDHAEAAGDPGAGDAWDREIERRIAVIDAGLAEGRPFAEVLQRIDARLKR
jgi:putative addiction module component (TIGR02574 family)